MNSLLYLAYEGVAQLARAAAAIAPERDSKATRAFHARRGIRERYARWGASTRDASRPLLWMHAPSVGEGLQARPILSALRAAHPDVQLAYTFFSPSAAAFARSLAVDFREYLPFDAVGDARAALDALRPTALAFSKLDVWPTLVREAHRRGVGLGLLSATLAADSSRRSVLARSLLREAYAALDAVGAIDAGDAERLVTLGVRASVVTITGDTRYDQVWERAAASDRTSAPLASLISSRPTMVAGSTWPADERQLLRAWLRVRRTVADARLIIAPHEPGESHLQPIEAWARDGGLSLRRLGALPRDAKGNAVGAPDRSIDVVLIDRVGVLGDLYALADIAYVGGGFHAAGLHSVLEPAAFGAPVLFGPRHTASRDAMLLLAAGGARAVDSDTAIATAITDWLADSAARQATGTAAKELVRSGLGATRRSLGLVERLLDRAPRRA